MGVFSKVSVVKESVLREIRSGVVWSVWVKKFITGFVVTSISDISMRFFMYYYVINSVQVGKQVYIYDLSI